MSGRDAVSEDATSLFLLSHLSVLYREDSSGTMNRTPGRRRRTMRLRDTGLTAEELKEW